MPNSPPLHFSCFGYSSSDYHGFPAFPDSTFVSSMHFVRKNESRVIAAALYMFPFHLPFSVYPSTALLGKYGLQTAVALYLNRSFDCDDNIEVKKFVSLPFTRLAPSALNLLIQCAGAGISLLNNELARTLKYRQKENFLFNVFQAIERQMNGWKIIVCK